MHIDPWTVALQAVNFLILVWLLRRFLFRPVMDLVEQRRKALAATLADAETRRAEADVTRKTYDDKLAALHRERDQVMSELRAAAAQERIALLDRATLEANGIVEAGKAQLLKEKESLSKEITDRIGQLAVSFAGQLLADVGTSATDELLLARLERELTDLPPERRQALMNSLGDGVSAVIVTAAMLNAESQEHWRQRLAAVVPPLGKAQFKTESSLIAGVQIRYPLGHMDFSWRRILDEASQDLGAGHVAA